MARLSILDRAIGYVSPRAMAARVQSRALAQATIDAAMVYDGATRSFRTAGRRIASTSANTESLMSLARLRDVSRDLRRNNAIAANAVSVISANVVGAGIVPVLDKTTPTRPKKRVEAAIKSHLETTDIDTEGRHDYYGLQRLIINTVVESGEALIVRMIPDPSLRLSVPLQVRVLEPDYLDSTVHGPMGNGVVAYQGIEVDSKTGRRVAYHLFTEHPGGGPTWQLPKSQRVPAEDVHHIYRVDRPGQMRGIPWGAPVIMTMWDLAEYEDADLVRQKIAACFSVFLKGADVSTNLAERQSGARARSENVIDKLNPGLIQKLPPGVEATFATPPTVVGQADFIRMKGHRIAAGYGVPYELLTTDNSDVSFISGRLGLLQFNRTVDQWRWHMMIPHACQGIMRWFLEACAVPFGVNPLFLRSIAVKHTPPRREMIDPATEIPAMRDAIRAGLSSRSEELRGLGFDPENIDHENAADNERADNLGVSYDSDGRRPLLLKQDIKPGADDAAGEDPKNGRKKKPPDQ